MNLSLFFLACKQLASIEQRAEQQNPEEKAITTTGNSLYICICDIRVRETIFYMNF